MEAGHLTNYAKQKAKDNTKHYLTFNTPLTKVAVHCSADTIVVYQK